MSGAVWWEDTRDRRYAREMGDESRVVPDADEAARPGPGAWDLGPDDDPWSGPDASYRASPAGPR